MPTTLFVLVNAVINAFRLVDHIVVMTRGGPDNATALLLYYIYEIGFRFWDSAYAAALTMVLLVLLGVVRSHSSCSSSAGRITNERAQACYPADLRARGARPRLETSPRGCSASCGCCRSRTRSGRRSIRRSSRRISRCPRR
jgi:hypothetical protein